MEDDPLGILSTRALQEEPSNPGARAVPTEELKKVDFSRIKLKEHAVGPVTQRGSTTDVFLARPKDGTTSGLLKQLLPGGSKTSERAWDGVTVASSSSYGLFDAPTTPPAEASRVPERAESARVPIKLRTGGEGNDDHISDLRVGKALELEEGLDELFGAQSQVRPKGAPPPPPPPRKQPPASEALLSTDEEEADLLVKLARATLKDPFTKGASGPSFQSAEGDSLLADLQPGPSALDGDLFSMLDQEVPAQTHAVDDNFDFDDYIRKHT